MTYYLKPRITLRLTCQAIYNEVIQLSELELDGIALEHIRQLFRLINNK